MIPRSALAPLAALVTGLATPAPGQAPPESVRYRLLPESRLEVKTGRAGLFGFAGHDHIIRARAFSGELTFVPADPARSRLLVVVPADSLEVLTPPDTAEIRQVTEAMREEVLHVDRFPEITFASREVKPIDGGYRVVGALTMHGTTREVPVDFRVKFAGDTLRADAGFSVKQTDFGIEPYSGGPLGTVKVADKVTFRISAVAIRVEAAEE